MESHKEQSGNQIATFRRSLSKYSAGGQKAAQAPGEDTKD